jgi:hypothetical protein
MRFSVLLLPAVLTMAAYGQVGLIKGKVLNPVGAPFADATVIAKTDQGGAALQGISSPSGEYSITAPAGTYVVTVNVGGLAGYEKKSVLVEAGKTFSLDIHLQEGTQLSTLGEDPLARIVNLKRHHPPSGPTPRTADGKPDLSGVWWATTTTDPGKSEFLPAAELIATKRSEMNLRDGPQAKCLPSAVTRASYPLYEFVQSKAFLVIILDDDSPGFHQVYLDGRDHPKDPNPSWYGHSIGRWDGDTLVVDRVGFDERAWLDQAGHPHSDKLHVIERYRRPDLGHLEMEITVDDPGVLAKPWVSKRVSDLANEEINEFICTENNRDVEHLVGK